MHGFIQIFREIISGKSSFIKQILFILSLLLLILWITASAGSVFKTKKDLTFIALSDSVELIKRADFVADTVSARLLKTVGFKKALLEMSTTDSIGLIVNLPDSLVQLSLKGVIIHSSKTTFLKSDPLLNRLDPLVQYLLFSQPLKVNRHFATIIKEPVVVRKAPKDTTEARLNAWKPDTLIQKPAFLELEIQSGIRIVFSQNEKNTLKNWFVENLFHLKRKLRQTGLNIRELIRFNWSGYVPEIRIELSADELRSVYRALPERGYVIIYN